MTEGEIVCVAPVQDLNLVDRNDHGHVCVWSSISGGEEDVECANEWFLQ